MWTNLWFIFKSKNKLYNTLLFFLARESFFPSSLLLSILFADQHCMSHKLLFRICSYHYSLYLSNICNFVDRGNHPQDMQNIYRRNMDAETNSVARLLMCSKQTFTCMCTLVSWVFFLRREKEVVAVNTLVDGHSHAMKSPISLRVTLENPTCKQLSLGGTMPAVGQNESSGLWETWSSGRWPLFPSLTWPITSWISRLSFIISLRCLTGNDFCCCSTPRLQSEPGSPLNCC